MLEGIIRCLSNLIEHFHQSFYYYLLTTTFRYIPIGQYMITFGMILGSVSVFLASICIGEEVESFAIRAVPRQIIFQSAGLALYFFYLRMAHIVSLNFVVSAVNNDAAGLAGFFIFSDICNHLEAFQKGRYKSKPLFELRKRTSESITT